MTHAQNSLNYLAFIGKLVVAQTIKGSPHTQCKRSGFSPSLGRFPEEKGWEIHSKFVHGEFYGQRSCVSKIKCLTLSVFVYPW